MVKYRVDITGEVLDDVESLYEYIVFKLLAPENAMGQYNRIADAILTLESYPERFGLF
jgi:plasmid stabilisation system protein